METPIALHSVAHRVSHQIPAGSEMSRQNRATPPPQIKVSHLSPDLPVALSFHSQQARGAAGCWRVSRHFWVPKTDRATGASQLQPHQSRYSVQLSPHPSNSPVDLQFPLRLLTTPPLVDQAVCKRTFQTDRTSLRLPNTRQGGFKPWRARMHIPSDTR